MGKNHSEMSALINDCSKFYLIAKSSRRAPWAAKFHFEVELWCLKIFKQLREHHRSIIETVPQVVSLQQFRKFCVKTFTAAYI